MKSSSSELTSERNIGTRWAIAVECSVALGVTLVLFPIGWLILSTSIADHEGATDPKSALGWRSAHSVALLSMAEDSFVRATRPAGALRTQSILYRPLKSSELTLEVDRIDAAPARAEALLMERAERPSLRDLGSMARWIDLQVSKSVRIRGAGAFDRSESESELAEIVRASEPIASPRSPVTARYAVDHLDATLLERNMGAAKAFAQRSLISDPLQQGAVVLLSDIAARSGDRARSAALLRLAAERSFRDVVSQTRLMDFQVGQSDYRGALSTADALMRNGGQIPYLIREFLTSAAMDARSYSALSDVLASEPFWRQWIFQSLSAYQDTDSGLRLLSEHAKSGNALHASDLEPILQLMTKQGRTTEAYLAWIGFLPQTKKSKAKLIFDGDFTEEPSNIPFEWNVTPLPRGSVGFVGNPNSGSGRTIRIQFVGERYPRLSVYQLLSLSPGRYALTMEAMADSLRAAQGVVWRISCVQERERVLAETAALRGSTSWREISVDFEMPADSCDFPVLRLVLKAKSAPEQVANGTAFFRNMDLVRRPARSADSTVAPRGRRVDLLEDARLHGAAPD
ncbi:hypothetical protein [Methylocapsa aurea]|uniref:hypothetical protein n=1 Tax=Methylocapsa aurea TaxID=663610 RepID=UPI003D18CB1D